jgi:uncharacterized protein (TIGR03435 family)
LGGLDAEVCLTDVSPQLGLRLVPRELTVTDLVIDHIERPSKN